MFGPFGQIEDGFIGVGAGFGQTRNGRQCGAGARGDDEAPGRDPLGAGDDLVRCRKARLCPYHLNAKRLEALDAVVRSDRRDDPPDMRVNRGEVDAGRGRRNAEFRRTLPAMSSLGCGDHRL